MFTFLENGWATFATGKMQREDTNKDKLGKGTLQRFMESNFKELDEYCIENLNTLLANVLDPTTCLDKYIPHFESWFGITVYPASLVLPIRRKVISMAMFYYKKKCTKLCIESLLNLIDSTVVITETHNDFSFDSPITFDDPVRTFDQGRCYGCSAYTLDITRNSLVTTLIDYLLGVYSIVKFNHPIGATLDSCLVNTVELTDIMLAQFVLQGGVAIDITGTDGYYTFIQTGNIIPSTKQDGNLKVINGVLSLNL